ncbi:hypothetical protein [Roseofilum capinflatum]|uniref:Flagellar motor protein n=1 Tax=Roseofilum capinflatum BLCC-M114 TaxID=3022440 RepID=A0ABT7BA43_9CYAN|nr:hypothetical protein [Roseofilum capinflatum]MDJ1175163.1 hypothetical protein [Roseofilum capinflatum BLCC-M114]
MTRRKYRNITTQEDLKIWTAFTDLMSNAFMILTLFLLLALIKSFFLKSVSDANVTRSQELESQLANLQLELDSRTSAVQGLEGQVANLQDQLQRRENVVQKLQGEIERLKSPPVIVLRESQARSFPSGSAELSSDFQQYILEDLVTQIENFAQNYQGYVVEVIGHTDGQENTGSVSNLDGVLEDVVAGSASVSRLNPGSNADLGLMRAVAVVKVLESNPRLQSMGLQFKAYSAAQLYGVSGNFAPTDGRDNPSRRRIEIRFTPPAVER